MSKASAKYDETDDELLLEQRIRKRVEEKLKARNDVYSTVTVFVMISILLWTIWAFTGASFPWPVFPMMGFAIATFFVVGEYYSKHGPGYERRERAIQEEIEKERERLGLAKRKNEDRSLHIGADGELSSTPLDVYDPYYEDDDQGTARR